jgi:hypothetical protein
MVAELSDCIYEIAETCGLPESELFERADREREVVQKDIDRDLKA